MLRPCFRCFLFRHRLYQLREDMDIKPETFASLLFFMRKCLKFSFLEQFDNEPVIAGLGDEDKPFFCTMDSTGAKEPAKDFVVAGTASESLMVLVRQCSSLRWEPEELFEIVSQALLSSVDRDCLSGWGGHVYVVTPTEVKKGILKGRMD
ncbi:proteasome subunit beta type-3-A [Prunus yedoensis var. nudiflora]|uniref:Proteasome subunit beta type-3-A n=1 Tax=Prunus yedoensis var. nudiflora TaxID=2094558 RepID=A0A314XG09_PRUYE|nr:proteasome subunit beta type-3-A [Prunus yedoensis var. nudiflora]